jgi:hypothetical protein
MCEEGYAFEVKGDTNNCVKKATLLKFKVIEVCSQRVPWAA